MAAVATVSALSPCVGLIAAIKVKLADVLAPRGDILYLPILDVAWGAFIDLEEQDIPTRSILKRRG